MIKHLIRAPAVGRVLSNRVPFHHLTMTISFPESLTFGRMTKAYWSYPSCPMLDVQWPFGDSRCRQSCDLDVRIQHPAISIGSLDFERGTPCTNSIQSHTHESDTGPSAGGSSQFKFPTKEESTASIADHTTSSDESAM